jgi:putative MATE family efflux protein
MQERPVFSMKNNRKEELGSAPVGRLLWRYSLPAIAGMSGNALYNLVDAIFVGQGVGTLALGALAVSFPMQLIVLAFGHCLGIGTSSIVSRALGAGDDEKAARAVGTLFAAVVLVSLAISSAGLLFLEPLLRALGATDAVLPYAREYMWVNFLGSVFLCFGAAVSSAVRAEGNARAAMTSILIGTGLNIVLDPLFIFVFGWGITGAATATVIATAFMTLYLIVYYASERSLLRIGRGDIRIEPALLSEAVRIGASALARLVLAGLVNVLVNNFIRAYGREIHLALLTTIYRMMTFASLPVHGIGQGLQPIIGFNYGAGDSRRVVRAYSLALAAAGTMYMGFFLVMMLFPESLLSLFSGDPALIGTGSLVMRTMILAMPVAALQMTGYVLFQATGKAGPALLLSASPQIAFLPILLALSPTLGLQGIWFSFPAAELAAFFVTLVAVSAELRALKRSTPAVSPA